MLRKEIEKIGKIKKLESKSLPNETEMMSLLILSTRKEYEEGKMMKKSVKSIDGKSMDSSQNNSVFADNQNLEFVSSTEKPASKGFSNTYTAIRITKSPKSESLNSATLESIPWISTNKQKKSPSLEGISPTNSFPRKSPTHDSPTISGSSISEGKAYPNKYKSHSKQNWICDLCGKVYKHPNCLSKHRWEHTAAWKETNKLSISKHQQVQLLEAASVLIGLSNPYSTEFIPTLDIQSSTNLAPKSSQSSITSYSPTNLTDLSQLDKIEDSEMRSDDDSVGSEPRMFKMEEL